VLRKLELVQVAGAVITVVVPPSRRVAAAAAVRGPEHAREPRLDRALPLPLAVALAVARVLRVVRRGPARVARPRVLRPCRVGVSAASWAAVPGGV
jgi:hypothetical protein